MDEFDELVPDGNSDLSSISGYSWGYSSPSSDDRDTIGLGYEEGRSSLEPSAESQSDEDLSSLGLPDEEQSDEDLSSLGLPAELLQSDQDIGGVYLFAGDLFGTLNTDEETIGTTGSDEMDHGEIGSRHAGYAEITDRESGFSSSTGGGQPRESDYISDSDSDTSDIVRFSLPSSDASTSSSSTSSGSGDSNPPARSLPPQQRVSSRTSHSPEARNNRPALESSLEFRMVRLGHALRLREYIERVRGREQSGLLPRLEGHGTPSNRQNSDSPRDRHFSNDQARAYGNWIDFQSAFDDDSNSFELPYSPEQLDDLSQSYFDTIMEREVERIIRRHATPPPPQAQQGQTQTRQQPQPQQQRGITSESQPTVIDLTDEPDSPGREVQEILTLPDNPRFTASRTTARSAAQRMQSIRSRRQQMSQQRRRRLAPSLSRSDGSTLGPEASGSPPVIDLTTDSPPSSNPPYNSRGPLRDRPQNLDTQDEELAFLGFFRRLRDAEQRNNLFSGGLDLIHRLGGQVFGRQPAEVDVQILGHNPLPTFVPNMNNPLANNPVHFNYQANGFNRNGASAPKPAHVPPPPARPGFTRATGEDVAVICPSCDQELQYDEDGDEQEGPPTKKPRTRKDHEEHHFWAVKACGHVYCKTCYEYRRPTAKNSVKTGFKTDQSRKIICAVEDCNSDVTAKGAWVGIFL
ncbi:hypothetical protein VTK73DRAFT_6672 [Phialemonium thermophilum]|uniref:Cell cycle control protein n=1 Tax=Phialemonium thermophilum TaxID=223376 RepID=A0ABR3WIE2_9PEZI